MVKEFYLARQEGLEPPTFWFVAKHSIQLSYWRICDSFEPLIYNIIAWKKSQV